MTTTSAPTTLAILQLVAFIPTLHVPMTTPALTTFATLSWDVSIPSLTALLSFPTLSMRRREDVMLLSAHELETAVTLIRSQELRLMNAKSAMVTESLAFLDCPQMPLSVSQLVFWQSSSSQQSLSVLLLVSLVARRDMISG
jgi:hypothetical protein